MVQETDIQSVIARILAAPLQDAPDTPVSQNYFEFDGTGWSPSQGAQPTSDGARTERQDRFRLITWNIDVLSPGGGPRMKAALQHIEALVSRSAESVVIFFQEMSKSDLNQISDAPWIRNRFYITDPDDKMWTKAGFGPVYGTATLIDRTLSVVAQPFRVLVPSRFKRDALFVDVRLPGDRENVLRLCNVHLESLVANPPVRPLQVARAASFMKAEHIRAALLAGDLNAIEPFDRTLHVDNRLKDAYLELGGKEDSEDGYTWGQQAPKALRDQFGCSRMDKAFYCGDLKVLSLERVGEGIEVEDEAAKEAIRQAGGEVFASDHLGLSIVFELQQMRGSL